MNKSSILFLNKKILKNLFIGSLSSIAFLLALILLSLSLLLGSHDAREWLVQDIAPQFISTSSTQLDVQGFSSTSFGSWYFENLSLKVNNKTLFNIEKLLLNFDASMLLERRLDIIELSAKKLLIEIPNSEKNNKDVIAGSSFLNWKDYLCPIRLQKLNLSHIDVINSKMNIPAFQIEGESSFLWNDIFFQSALLLKTKSQPEATINLQANIDEHFSGKLTTKIQEEANGWIGQIIKLPKSQAVDFNLELKAHPDKETVNWELLSFNMPWQAHQIRAFGQGSWQTSNEQLKLSQLSVFVDDKQQHIHGWWQDKTFELNAMLDKLPIGLADPFQDYITGGDITGSFSAAGGISDPSLKANLVAQTYYNNQQVKLDISGNGNLNTFNIEHALVNLGDAKAEASGSAFINEKELDLKILKLSGPLNIIETFDIKFPADLYIDISHTEGSLKGPFTAPKYAGFTKAAGRYKEQAFELKSNFSGDIAKVKISKFLANISGSDNETDLATINANGHYIFSTKKLNGKLTIEALPYQVFELFDIRLPPKLTGNIDTNLSISGQLPIPIVQGVISSEGIFEEEKFSFKFEGSQKDQTLRVDNTSIKWHNTRLSANGSVSKENLDFHVKLDELNIKDLNKFGYDFKPGSLDFNFNLLGSLNSPKIDGLIKLNVDKQPYADDTNETLGNILVTTKLITEDDLIVIHSDVKHGLEDKGNLQIQSTFKPFLNWLMHDSKTQVLADLPLNIRAEGDVGLNWINNFIDRDIQHISGKLILNTHVHGSINKPLINGALALSHGKYVNSLSQTSIENAEIELAFDEKSISIITAQANDGHKGSLTLNGKASLSDNDDGHIDLTLVLNKASLVRREDIEGDATGSIKLYGSLKEIVVSGDVEVSPFQIMLDLIPTESIPKIEVSVKEDLNQPSKNNITIPPIALNIKVGVEQQAYIRGRGLDAELKGKLTLSGTTKRPNYNGQFTVVRGSFELFAKTFKLEEGDVLFSNDAVSLFVQGRHKAKDITFIASLSGTLNDLKIGLRTEPVLPEDEALARLLFGKSVRNMTPIQAIQLASAIQTLRGEGGGFDPLGKARELFHVDNISVESQETTEGSGVAVGIGKYVTEDVYVELTRTPDPAQPWKGSVEVELSPSINLETTTGGSSGFGGVELQWKKDY